MLKRVWVPEKFNITAPVVKTTTRITKTAGRANHSMCEYNWNFIIQEGDKYDETICHEVCHVFANRLISWSKHGTLWEYLYKGVCKSQRGRYHSYDRVEKTPEVDAIKEILKLQKKIAACKEK